MQSVPVTQQAQQAQQGQSNSSSFGGNIWAQPEANQKEPAAASYEFGESAFNAPQAGSPEPQRNHRSSEVPRPKQLYINSLYNAEEGATEEQFPPGFDASQQVSKQMPQ